MGNLDKVLTNNTSNNDTPDDSRMFKAFKMMMPSLLRRLEGMSDDAIQILAGRFAKSMDWVANGGELTNASDFGYDLNQEVGTGVHNGGIGGGEVDSSGTIDRPVSPRVLESADSGSGLETPVHGTVVAKRTVSRTPVQTVGSRRQTRKLSVVADGDGTNSSTESGVEA